MNKLISTFNKNKVGKQFIKYVKHCIFKQYKIRNLHTYKLNIVSILKIKFVVLCCNYAKEYWQKDLNI